MQMFLPARSALPQPQVLLDATGRALVSSPLLPLLGFLLHEHEEGTQMAVERGRGSGSLLTVKKIW
jgi:hypothetical protein